MGKYDEVEAKLTKAIDALKNDYSMVRAGRANPVILDKINVDYYGQPTPIKNLAGVSVPEARIIQIQPWDASALKEIEKAILSANIGVTPTNDGKNLKLVFPELTGDRRKELVKSIKKRAEEAKVTVRNIRRDAMEIYKKLLSSASATGKKKFLEKIGITYNVIGQNRISEANYPEGLKYSFLSLKTSEELGDRKGASYAEFNIGNIYFNQHNYPEALKHYLVCLKISEELGDKADIAGTYTAIGGVYYEQDNFEEALKNYSTALKLAEEAKDNLTLAEIYINLGVIRDKQGNISDALKHYFTALKIYEEIGINFQFSLIRNQIAMVYMKQKKYRDASEYLNQALAIAKASRNLEYIKLSYENWVALDSAMGNYKNAFHHNKLFLQYHDSLINDENKKQLVQQQMQYDFDKKEVLAKAEQEIKDAHQKNIRIIFILSIFGILLLSGGLWSRLRYVSRSKVIIQKEKERSEELLLNILPYEVSQELKQTGHCLAKTFSMVTVMFTDFKDFTTVSEKISAELLVDELNFCFSTFDNILQKYKLEKIKTVGDAYICVGGMPTLSHTHAFDMVKAAIEVRNFMLTRKEEKEARGEIPFELRIGIHTGPVVAGIVGVKKFQYDIWGDTVNLAARMESSGEAGQVNISGTTYALVKDKISCTHRGKIEAKNKGEIDMYFAENFTTQT